MQAESRKYHFLLEHTIMHYQSISAYEASISIGKATFDVETRLANRKYLSRVTWNCLWKHFVKMLKEKQEQKC